MMRTEYPLRPCLLVAMAALVGCSSNGEEDMTTGGVDAGVVESTSPADSRPADDNQIACTGVAAADSCTGETICVAGQCVPAFGRTYQFQVLGGALPLTDSQGATWDLNGGAPDPYVLVEMNNVEVLRTAIANNTFSLSTFESSFHVIPPGAVITATIFDDDLDSDDPVFVCTANPIRPADLRIANITCGDATLATPPAVKVGLFATQ